MKRWHYIVESILMILTAVAFLENRIMRYDFTNFSGWMLCLGVFQLLHAGIILLGYLHDKKIRWWIIAYWAAVIPYLSMFISGNFPQATTPLSVFLFPVLPLLFAVYLWYISFRFRKRRINDQETNNRNAVLF